MKYIIEHNTRLIPDPGGYPLGAYELPATASEGKVYVFKGYIINNGCIVPRWEEETLPAITEADEVRRNSVAAVCNLNIADIETADADTQTDTLFLVAEALDLDVVDVTQMDDGYKDVLLMKLIEALNISAVYPDKFSSDYKDQILIQCAKSLGVDCPDSATSMTFDDKTALLSAIVSKIQEDEDFIIQ